VYVNVDKTENTRLGHKNMDVNQDEWRNTRKLGSLLGIEEDVNQRIQLAFASFDKLEMLWKHRALVAEHIRI
jgi:hypothetical protein